MTPDMLDATWDDILGCVIEATGTTPDPKEITPNVD